MSARRFALFAALALLISFISLNVIANAWFRSWRVDLTENHLYTLSRGTQQTLDQLSEPIELTLYYSRDAAKAAPQLQAYAARVREMLQSYQARSRGRVRFVEIDVKPFSADEDHAEEAGVQPFRPFQGADPIYFGLSAANSINDRAGIPNLNPQSEQFLEYQITRLIFELEHPERTRVALITSLPIDPASAGTPGLGGPQSVLAAEMGRVMDVTKLAPDFTEIPDADVLAVIHPGALNQAQLYAIDQFILRKGRAFIAIDPAYLTGQQQSSRFDPFSAAAAPAPISSNLAPLMSRWGVSMAPTVVLDLDNALNVTVQDPQSGQSVDAPQPLFFAVPAEDMDREDLMTADLTRAINFGLAGGLTTSPREGVTVRALARTSGHTMRLPAEAALMQPSPFELQQMWPPTGGRRETVAVRLSGNLETAFPNGRPAPEAAATPSETPASEPSPNAGETPPVTPVAATPSAPPAAALRRSARPAEIVIVADADFLADDFFFDPRSDTPIADNGSFALNAIDVLGGSDALVSLRSRAQSVREMTLVKRMEEDADRRIRQRQEELQADAQETLGRLAELQAHGHGSGFFAGDLSAEMTPEENAEVQRLQRHIMQVRAEQRNNARNLRGDINRLQAMVVFINVWLAPLLVAVIGLFLFWRRQRRGSARR
jgi:ABC-type uncharacterized transport system involved in gliding motility auxiliary subunit